VNLELELLEESFDLLAPRGGELVDRFYHHLFTAAPHVRPLFAGADMQEQKAKLLGTLVLLRKSLRTLDALVPKLEALGAKHVAYGVTEEHYAPVGVALVTAMAELAGPAWNDRYEAAWIAAYGVVSGAMLTGAATLERAA
jgi:nitric oxide dioxygenase